MYSETLDTSVFTYLIQSNNQQILHIIRLEMLVVSVCLLEDINLIEEHVSSKRGFPSYIKKFQYMSMLDFFITAPKQGSR